MVYPNSKINLGLQVVERRPDGYHNLQSVFLPIGLCDELEVRRTEGRDIVLHESGLVLDSDREHHMLVKAYRLMQSEYGIGGVEVWFKKQTPFGAGLGGGSADAAFMLTELDRLFGLGLCKERLAELAGRLGADCPFFIYNEPMYVEGIGDCLSPIEVDLSGYWLVLVKPDIHVSTPEAYRHVVPRRPEQSVKELIGRYGIEEWRDVLRNDFEDSVFSQYPEIQSIKEQLYALGAVYASMSGSGSTVFAFFKKEVDLHNKFEKCFVFKQFFA